MPGNHNKLDRLFVAIYPPAAVVEQLLTLSRDVQVTSLLGVTPAHVHLTLVFLGTRSRRDIPHIEESIDRSVAGIQAFELAVGEISVFPTPDHPRLIAARCDTPGPLLEVQRRLVHRLAWPARDRAKSRFDPHLTLARFAPDSAPRSPLNLAFAPTPEIRFRVDRVCLMASDLLPGGARHRELRSFPLGG